MGRIIGLISLFVLSFQCSFGKAVDENTARTVAYNFGKEKGLTASPTELVLVYKATSVVNAAEVVDLYVFNQPGTGFVMVAGDDRVTPVLAYSTESSFSGNNMPGNILSWLSYYQKQINYAIEKNVTASSAAAAWTVALAAPVHAGGKTTADYVLPLCKTNWNQSPYYNALCPFDAGAGKEVVTGCVATAMSQVMKYWNWPRRGVGTHSYNSSYGVLSANFDSTVFQWDSMKNAVSYVDTAIAQLMYETGVSVNMSYGPTESGAFVNTNTSPIANCAQYALQTYFSYKASTLQGVFRSGYTDSDWVHLLKAEIDAARPCIYTGDGSQGGHCWVADGYETFDRIHFNWGWGGYCNGYYYVENLAPGGTDFNNGQTLMTGIEPDSTVIEGVKQMVGASNGASIYPNPANTVIRVALNGTKAISIRIVDMAGREVANVAVANNETVMTVPVNGLAEGTYLVELLSTEGTTTKKLTIAR